MSLYGTFSTMSLADLLQWLSNAAKTGTLEFEREKVVKQVVMREGHVIACSSDDPSQLLGHYLVSHGKVSEDVLRQALTEQGVSRRHLGQILVEMGVLTPEELSKHLADKAEETIFSLFDWDDAAFRFHESVQPHQAIFPVDLRVDEILLRGAHRLDEMQRIRSVFNDSGIVLRHTDKPAPAEILRNRIARQVYEYINGDRSLAEILLHAHASEYLVYKLLFEMFRAGFVKIGSVVRVEEELDLLPDMSFDGRPAYEPPSGSAPRTFNELPERGAQVVTMPPRSAAEVPAAYPPAAPPATPGFASSPASSPASSHAGSSASSSASSPATTPASSPSSKAATAATAPHPVASVSSSPAPAPAQPSTSLSADADLIRARALLEKNEFDVAIDILNTLYRAKPHDDSLRRLLAEAEASFVDKAYKHYVPASKIPHLRRSLESLTGELLSPPEMFLLSRIDGSWDVRSIIQVSPLREVDALLAMKRMREKGYIELREP